MFSLCARPNCKLPAKSSCSGCEREKYCGSACQKLDWKIHKSRCPILKKLSTKLQPFHEVLLLNDEILASTKVNDCRVLEHLISYLDYQFGEKVRGIDYRERANGEQITNWAVEVLTIHHFTSRLADLYFRNHSMSMMSRNEMGLPHVKRSLSLLNPWLIQFNLHANDQIDDEKKRHNDSHLNFLLHELHRAEQNMAASSMNGDHTNISEGHCRRCLLYSRRYQGGKEKITMMFTALRSYCHLRSRQGNLEEALTFAEEAYNLVVETYDCIHPQVQEAAGVLINILISKGNLYDAERYAQVTYDNLRDKKNGIDQDSDELAIGATNLALAIYQQEGGDLLNSEELARESLRIKLLIYGSDHDEVGSSCDLLANILVAKGQLGDEARGLYKRYLAISIRDTGPDGEGSAIANHNLGKLHYQLVKEANTDDSERTHLLLAKSYFEEALRIETKILGSNHPSTLENAAFLENVSNNLKLSS